MNKNYFLSIKNHFLILFLFSSFLACNDPGRSDPGGAGGYTPNPYQNRLDEAVKKIENLEKRRQLELEVGRQLMNPSQANFDNLGEIALQIENLNTKDESFDQQSTNILDELTRLSDEFEKKRNLVAPSDFNERHHLSMLIMNINSFITRLFNLQNNKKLDQLINGYRNLIQGFRNLRESMRSNFEIIKSALRDTIQSRQTMIKKIEKAIENMNK